MASNARRAFLLIWVTTCFVGVAPAGAALRASIVDLGPYAQGTSGDFAPVQVTPHAGVLGLVPPPGMPSSGYRDSVVMRAGTSYRLPGGDCSAADMNDGGLIVGSCPATDAAGNHAGGNHAVTWSFPPGSAAPSGPVRLAEPSGNGLSSYATGVSSNGLVSGYSEELAPGQSGGPTYEAPLAWSAAGAMQRLQPPSFDDPSQSLSTTGVNALGQVIGGSYDSRNGHVGHRWHLDAPGTVENVVPYSQVTHAAPVHPVDDRGDIVGGTHLLKSDGTLVGLDFSASVISPSGDAAGFQPVTDPRGTVAVLRLGDGTELALETLLPVGTGWRLNLVDGIDGAGDLVGTGTLNGSPHAWLVHLANPSLLGLTLKPGAVSGNDVFDLQLSVSNLAPNGGGDLSGISLGHGDGLRRFAGTPGEAAAALVPFLGPLPGYPSRLAVGETRTSTVAYGVDSPGATILQADGTASDAHGAVQTASAAVRVDATLRKPDRQALDGLVAGGLLELMSQAAQLRNRLAAKLAASVHRQIDAHRHSARLDRASGFDRALAAEENLPAAALAWIPEIAGGPKGRVATAVGFLTGAGSGLKDVAGNVLDFAALTPLQFYRDLLFSPSEGEQARTAMEAANLLAGGFHTATGYLGEAARFYTSPSQLAEAWTQIPAIEQEASTALHAVDVAATDAILNWDALMTRNPPQGAAQFGKLLAHIEGDVAIGELQVMAGKEIASGLNLFTRARELAGVKDAVGEAPGALSELAGTGATALAGTPELGNLSRPQISRFKQIVQGINAKFGVDARLEARPINALGNQVKGGIGKVEAIPTKNLTPDDVILGAPAKWLGQTAYYRPRLPAGFSRLGTDERERLTLRLEEKLAEFRQFIGEVADPTGKTAKVHKALSPAGAEVQLGRVGKLQMALTRTTEGEAVLIRYRSLAVNGRPVFTGGPRSIVSDVDFNAVVDNATGRPLPAGIRGQVELELMRQFAKAAEEGVFPFGYHGWTHSGFDVGAKDFRYILKYALMFMSPAEAARVAGRFARIYHVDPRTFLDGYTKGKLLVRITATDAVLGPGSGL